jgi:hypothetical protein
MGDKPDGNGKQQEQVGQHDHLETRAMIVT